MIETLERIAIAATVAVAVLGAVEDWKTDAPSVAQDYYVQTVTGGSLEEKYTAMGDYEVAYAEYPAADLLSVGRYEIWYPEAMAEQDRTWPVVMMCNGTGVAASRYTPIFEHLASWGFVVVGNEQQNSWSGADADDGIELLEDLNENPSTVFYHKLDLERVGAAGHSQGAIGAINAVTTQDNGFRYKALYTASTPSSLYAQTLNWAYDVSQIRIPYLMAAGTGLLDAGGGGTDEVSQQAQELSISPLWSQEENYKNIPDATPKVRARRMGADHAEMLPWADGYMTAWFMYWLQGDAQAGEAFFGPDAELAHNPYWQDVEKNI